MKNLAIPLGFLAVGILLMSNPNCRKGCRTVAEHLVNHGLEDFIKGLLAAYFALMERLPPRLGEG